MLGRVAPQFVRGYCMGAADIVPGVSGGTIALLFGIYERLVDQIRLGAGALAQLVRLDARAALERLRCIDWLWLGLLLAGIGTAVLSLASLLHHLIEEQPVYLAAIFFGLVAASIFVAWRLVDDRDAFRLGVMALVAVVSFVLLGLRSSTVDDPSLLAVAASGALAICAMILPGVSGSFILLMLGMYDYVIEAVKDRDVGTVVVFAFGATVGLGAFSTLLHWLLLRHRDTVLAALIGLMAGSLRVLWPWPAGEEGLDEVALGAPDPGQVPGALAGALIAAAVVIGLAMLSERRTHPAPAP